MLTIFYRCLILYDNFFVGCF